jgi:hypothetical protein
MGSHEPFGHLHYKLWQKEKLRVKLPVWLSTIKSQELTQPWCVQVKCDTSLESSWWELQVWSRPHPNWRSEQRVMTRVQIGTISGLLLGSLETKSHLDVAPMESCKVYYMKEGGGFPQVRAVVSLVSPESPVVCPNTKGALESELTNLLVGWMQIRVNN